jgi:hypothetical protein
MAAPVRVQNTSNTSLTTSVAATFSTQPIQGNVLLAVATSSIPVANLDMPGWVLVDNVSLGVSGGMSIFYKVAGFSEPNSGTATGILATFMDLHIYEYSGIDTTNPINSVVKVSDSGSGVTNKSSGTTTVAVNAPVLTFTAVAQTLSNGGSSSWTNNMNPGVTSTHLITADLPIFTSESQSASASWNNSQRAAGMLVTLNPTPGNTYYYQGGGQ